MNVSDALAGAAKGAAAGMVLGPAGAAVGGLGGLVLGLAPEIGRWLFGDDGAKTASEVADVVKSVTGTDDAEAAVATLADPEAAGKLRIALAQIAVQRQAEDDRAAEARRAAELADFKAAIEDKANARSTMLSLASASSSLAWAPAMVSAIILLAFGLLIWVVLTRSVGQSEIANVLLGTLAAMAAKVADYWLGSSASSSAKTDALSALTAQAQTTVPAEIVHRLLPPVARPVPIDKP